MLLMNAQKAYPCLEQEEGRKTEREREREREGRNEDKDDKDLEKPQRSNKAMKG